MKWKASLDYYWFAYISKGTQQAMKAEQRDTNEAVNSNERNKTYPTDNSVTQTVQYEATPSGQDTQNISETSS